MYSGFGRQNVVRSSMSSKQEEQQAEILPTGDGREGNILTTFRNNRSTNWRHIHGCSVAYCVFGRLNVGPTTISSKQVDLQDKNVTYR